MNTRETHNSKKLKEVQKLLMTYYPIWEKEVLNYYPDSYQNFPKKWVEEIKNLSDHDRWQVDNKTNFLVLKNSNSTASRELFDLFTELEEIITIAKKDDLSQQLTIAEKNGIKVKKQHEVERLLSFLKGQQPPPSKYIDIGGGKGHLSRLVSHKMGRLVECIEMNESLIKKGKILLKNKEQVSFTNAFLDPEKTDNCKHLFKRLKDNHSTMCIGLHTCGPLADTIIQASTKSKIPQVLNFGCCYLKMTPSKNRGLSESGRQFSIPLSKYALTLATRAHTGTSWDDFQMKKKVKFYRYGIHLYLYYVLGIRRFINVGDGTKQDYESTFAHYVIKKLKHLEIKNEQSEDEINNWFYTKGIQQKIDEMFCMNIIRWQFGRAIELWILLDRACYLEENGYQVKLEEYFDEKISPRNIGIYGKILANEQHL